MSFHGKMTEPHLWALRCASLDWLRRYPPAYYRARGLSDARHRWDMLWHAVAHGAPPMTELYAYLNDATIDSALRYIVRTQSSGGVA